MVNGSRSLVPYLIGSLALLVNLVGQAPLVDAGKDKGDDIILAKGKIILRGGKGKGNIILDPGQSGESGHHEMPPMMSMMGHFNPYTFYPMQHHHQPQLMIRPVYIEDHSSMHPMAQHHQQYHEEHHEEPQHHHEQHEYRQEEPQQHHYEAQHHEIEHQPQYEGGEEQHHHEGYESQQGQPLLSLMSMHGSGPQPIYQPNQQRQRHSMAAMQAYQQPTMYAQLSQEQQHQMAYQQAQFLDAEREAALKQQNQPQELQQGQSSEVSSHSPSDSSGSSSSSGPKSSSKPASKVTALLEKSANNPLIQRIRPLFKRNKDHKDSQKKS